MQYYDKNMKMLKIQYIFRAKKGNEIAVVILIVNGIELSAFRNHIIINSQ